VGFADERLRSDVGEAAFVELDQLGEVDVEPADESEQGREVGLISPRSIALT
jgi:hypothetical protein